jgi:hypothetical protein
MSTLRRLIAGLLILDLTALVLWGAVQLALAPERWDPPAVAALAVGAAACVLALNLTD